VEFQCFFDVTNLERIDLTGNDQIKFQVGSLHVLEDSDEWTTFHA
jgi:hypothetical protein